MYLYSSLRSSLYLKVSLFFSYFEVFFFYVLLFSFLLFQKFEVDEPSGIDHNEYDDKDCEY